MGGWKECLCARKEQTYGARSGAKGAVPCHMWLACMHAPEGSRGRTFSFFLERLLLLDFVLLLGLGRADKLLVDDFCLLERCLTRVVSEEPSLHG